MGENTTPSFVGYRGTSLNDMQITVGRNASQCENWIYDAKRMIGRSFDDESVHNYKRKWPFEVVAGPRQNFEI